MDKDNYSKRELDYHFEEVKRDLKDIKIQTTKTNGRVTALERWMWSVIGGLALLSFLLGSKVLNIFQ